MKKIAFYGGSFDPIHNGHLAIAKTLVDLFSLDEFYFVPAFHAPHKRGKKVSSPFCRYAMLALATGDEPEIKISTIELEAPEKPYTIETLTKLINHYEEKARIFFVMGADSWNEIDTWREWQKLLLITDIIVVTRPGYELQTTHVTPEIQARLVDLKEVQQSAFHHELVENSGQPAFNDKHSQRIYFTDAVQLNISSTEIRREISSQSGANWHKLVPTTVANYIEKYNLYQ